MTLLSRSLLVAALFVAAFGVRAHLESPQPVTTARPLSTFPRTIDGWRAEDAPLPNDVLKIAAVDDYVNRFYRSEAGELSLYVGYYRSQREGESLHSPMNCLPGVGWAPMRTDVIALDAGSRTETINRLMVEKGIDRLLVLYWYQTAHRVTASEYARKLNLITDALRMGRTDVALVRVIAPIDPTDRDGEGHALALTRPFAARILPEVQRQLFD